MNWPPCLDHMAYVAWTSIKIYLFISLFIYLLVFIYLYTIKNNNSIFILDITQHFTADDYLLHSTTASPYIAKEAPFGYTHLLTPVIIPWQTYSCGLHHNTQGCPTAIPTTATIPQKGKKNSIPVSLFLPRTCPSRGHPEDTRLPTLGPARAPGHETTEGAHTISSLVRDPVYHNLSRKGTQEPLWISRTWESLSLQGPD